jgi:hypothetical protein
MREWISLFEDVVDFDRAVVQHEGRDYYMLLPLNQGGKIMIDATVVLNTLIVRDIRSLGDNPESSHTLSKSGNRRRTFKIGPAEVRKMLEFVVDRVRQDFPKIDNIKGNRVTGARAPDDKNSYAQIDLPAGAKA